MPGTTEAITFTDSYKHMECLGGMMLQSFLMVTLFTRATPGTPASFPIKMMNEHYQWNGVFILTWVYTV